MQQTVDSLDVDPFTSDHIKNATAAECSAQLISEHNQDSLLLEQNKLHMSGADLDHGLISTVYSQTDVTFGSLTSYPLLYLVGCVTVLCFALCDVNEAKLNV